jgi:hypothetical protein
LIWSRVIEGPLAARASASNLFLTIGSLFGDFYTISTEKATAWAVCFSSFSIICTLWS